MKFISLTLIWLLITQGLCSGLFFVPSKELDITKLSETLGADLLKKDSLPTEIEWNEKKFTLSYFINEKLQDFIKRSLRRYGASYTTIVVIDNNNGQIIGLQDYDRDKKKLGHSLSFAATHPAASIFKIVSAAHLIDKTKVTKDTVFTYNGKSTTLYKYQLKDKKNKWTRKRSFEKAFASSNNVIFGKAMIKYSSGLNLYKTAKKFGFDTSLMEEVPIGSSHVPIATDSYNLAEIASGFNKKTHVSPIHAALLPLTIANEGKLFFPRFLKEIKDDSGKILWSSKLKEQKVISRKSASQVSKMMMRTISKGTARRSFRRLRSKYRNNFSIGGKTGSITGGVPYGKRDWFVSFAKPKKTKDKGISVAIMSINKGLWRVKSAELAKKVIEYYYGYVSK